MGQIDRTINRVKVLISRNFEKKSAMSIALLPPPHKRMHKHTNIYPIYIYIYIYIYIVIYIHTYVSRVIK